MCSIIPHRATETKQLCLCSLLSAMPVERCYILHRPQQADNSDPDEEASDEEAEDAEGDDSDGEGEARAAAGHQRECMIS